MSQSVISKSEPNDASKSPVLRNGDTSPAQPRQSLFGPEPVRVRDLIGEVALPQHVATPQSGIERSFTSPVVVTPARRGGRLTLSWYDYGVVALIGASLIAGIICLLHGV